MRDFNDYLARERKQTEYREWEYQQYKARKQRTREERKRQRRWRIHWFAVLMLWALFITWVLFFPVPGEASAPEETTEPVPTEIKIVGTVPPELPVEEEPDPCLYLEVNTPAAEPEPPYLREDVPLEPEMQALLYEACGETGIDYELALAVIRKESTYQNVMGDGGESYGYMQVQPRWHRDRMDRLGVTDLMDPLSNFRVGCDYLAELLGKYELEAALTAYNTGSPGHNEYADIVIGYWEELN